MKYLAIDTSSKRLIVIAKGQKTAISDLPDCAMQHSVRLMGEIDRALKEAELTLHECDLLSCVVGPGSFTGIRIGIATVKGLCAAAEKPALAVTSFDCLAYAEKSGKKLCLVDAGHGYYYACPYDGTTAAGAARYLSEAEAKALIFEGYVPISAEKLPIGSKIVSPAEGLLAATEALQNMAAPCAELHAEYLRKSNAEEGR